MNNLFSFNKTKGCSCLPFRSQAGNAIDRLHVSPSSVRSKCSACGVGSEKVVAENESWASEHAAASGTPPWCFLKQDLPPASQWGREGRLCCQANGNPNHKTETTSTKQCIKMWWWVLFACIPICIRHFSCSLKTLEMECN